MSSENTSKVEVPSDHRHSHTDHDHGGHDQGHDHAPKDFGRAFFIGVLLNAGFVAVEVVYGILGNSLALLADAGHNLSDVLGLMLAWGASVLVKKAPTRRFTYGLRSTSILAALINAALLLLVTGGIAWEAILRSREPGDVQGKTVIAVAAVGVGINLATALLFMSGRKGDLNVRAAFTHMAGDAAIAFGVVLAGFAILYTGSVWLDPLVSLVIAVLVIVGTWGLLRDSVALALDAVPQGIDIEKVRLYLASVAGVTEVHDLHVWGMSTIETALTAHLVIPSGYPGDSLRNEICTELRAHFSVNHATIQIELGDSGQTCELAPAHVVADPPARPAALYHLFLRWRQDDACLIGLSLDIGRPVKALRVTLGLCIYARADRKLSIIAEKGGWAIGEGHERSAGHAPLIRTLSNLTELTNTRMSGPRWMIAA